MEGKVNIKNSKLNKSPIILNSHNTKIINSSKDRKSWQDNILLYILVGVLIILIGSYLIPQIFDNDMGKKNSSSKVNIENSSLKDSPVVVDSPGTIIGKDITINPLVDIPEPIFEKSIESSNVPGWKVNVNKVAYNNVYKTDIILRIISKFPINRLFIEITAPSVIGMEIQQNYATSVLYNTNMTFKEGNVKYSFTNALGSYRMSVYTKVAEKDLLSSVNIVYE